MLLFGSYKLGPESTTFSNLIPFKPKFLNALMSDKNTKPRAWLCAICLHLCMSVMRKKNNVLYDG